MTRLVTEGFEMGDVGRFTGFGYGVGTSGAIAHSGVYGANASSIGAGYMGNPLGNQITTSSWVRCWVYDPGWRIYIQDLTASVAGLSYLLTIADDGSISFGTSGNNAIVFGTKNSGTFPGGWHMIEFYIKMDTNGTDGAAEFKLDGHSMITYSGHTTPTWSTAHLRYHDRVDILTSSGRHLVGFDDFAWNDNQGAADNSWCGDGRILALTPNATSSEQWTSSSAGDNHLMVDETPSDGDTTYVEALSAGLRDVYGVTTYSIPSGYEIKRVWAEARARATIPDGTGKVKIGIKSGTNENQSSAIPVLATYGPVKSPEWRVSPDTTLPFSQAEVDALEVTIESAD